MSDGQDEYGAIYVDLLPGQLYMLDVRGSHLMCVAPATGATIRGVCDRARAWRFCSVFCALLVLGLFSNSVAHLSIPRSMLSANATMSTSRSGRPVVAGITR